MQEKICEKMLFNNKFFFIIAGPCTIESYQKTFNIAKKLKKMGVIFFRGGAFKMRTSPESFQGLKQKGIEIIERVCRELGIYSVSEITSIKDIELFSEKIDVILVGTRNMQNFPLLSELGKLKKPVILKRGMSSSIKEWLLAVEYITKEGNDKIILCERGIRTFETYTRNTFDISSIPAIKELSSFPIIADPSHSTGKSSLVKSISLAAAAAGADGLMIETETNPDKSICDSRQTIDLQKFEEILINLNYITKVWDKQCV